MLLEFELRSAPITYPEKIFSDKRGLSIGISELTDGGVEPLIELYKAFDIESQFQGLPPENMVMRKAWLQKLLRDGFHLVAATKEIGIVGHAALVELPARRSCEFLTVVMKEHRNNGIGTRLAESSIDWARILGYTSVWLTVAATNTRAIHVYKKVGFDVLSYSAELEMEAKT